MDEMDNRIRPSRETRKRELIYTLFNLPIQNHVHESNCKCLYIIPSMSLIITTKNQRIVLLWSSLDIFRDLYMIVANWMFWYLQIVSFIQIVALLDPISFCKIQPILNQHLRKEL